jgi:eukaryotic-like serine/threonine-protein kinase
VGDAVLLGRYEIVKHLASGGMAEVLLARATGIENFERYVVVKRIHRERAKNEQVVKMFLDEARLAASLHHTNIVQVHDIGQDNGEYFFAMEYVHGEDLRRLLTHLSAKKQQLPIEHVLTIIMSTAAALHYAHEMKGAGGKPLGLVHRDVSPANVIVGFDGNVKVVDFGIAKATVRSTETQSGILKGKISYMAPEQCLSEPVDRRSDVFALGIVLFELYTVRRLFKGASEYLTMTSIVQGNIPKPSTYRPEIPPELEAIMMKALAMDPAQRYQTADELRVALKDYATAHHIQWSPAALADYMTEQFGHRPEPWLVDDDDEAIIEIVDVDFDGSASGAAPVLDRHLTPPPGSLLARARRKLAIATGIPIDAPKAAAPTDEPSSPAFSPIPPTGSGTPMAWIAPSPAPVAAATRRRWVFGGAGAMLLAAVVLVVSARSGSRSEPAQPTAASAPIAPAPAPIAPPPPPPPPAPPAPAPAAVVEPVSQPQPVKPSAKPVKKSTKPKPAWDPHSLFLNKP